MQPYQEATQEVKRQGELPLELAKKAGSIGASAATAYLGGGAINRVLPFLSKYIPENLVKKGLSKIDPRYGKFIDKALSAGQSIEDVKNFIGEKIEESSPKEKPKESRNIIQQYSPELHEFMEQSIKSGKSPIQAAALAQVDTNDNNFRKIINKMTRDHKTDWSAIVESIYGNVEQGKAALQDQNPQQQQPGQGQQALMSILKKIQQARSGG